ncbi:MAG: hydroxymethylpyrimidine/phosphomethylpyrimidine kinase [Halomonas sp. HL-48]|nr:hydroxymethylpyrimidine/phosphomethylpyrimidine kinase [Halomonas sp. HL-48]KPQ25827.1 MAG: hydroxymethylpyrimidine/phosphomethylpyrimidine kinase [Halomonas sp. HL-48]
MRRPLPPVVLVLAGHDPTGGAGLIADSQSITACGGWAVTIPTALTIQNCQDVVRVVPTDAQLMGQMVDEIASMPVAAIKLGLISHEATLKAVVAIIRRFPGVPVVADPVLKAGGGAELSTPELRRQYREQLLPMVDILTPNRAELAMLTPESPPSDDDTARAVALLSLGCQAVLVSATDDPLPGNDHQVLLTLHSPDNTRQWHWPRLPESFHGSGCTLSSAIAARLAVGERLLTACEQAQHFTWHSLSQGYQPTGGQCLPNRSPRTSRF